ncbi:hypothetical protein DFH28DRAFT_928407 [Melampsora americana]|nr:hypothetical protein DFH28DRAFT_928407 [Melampsora americana]
MVKRPIGLKASKSTKKPKPNNPEDKNSTSRTIGFKTDANEGEDQDGLTIEDLQELKNQSEQNLIKFQLLETPEFGYEASNLLRGICHECYRRINNMNEESRIEGSVFNFLSWASLYLGLLIYPIGIKSRSKFIQIDEPKELKYWCLISSKALESEIEKKEGSNEFDLLEPTIYLTQALLEPLNESNLVEKFDQWTLKVEEKISDSNLSDSQLIWSITSSLQLIESISPNWDDDFLKIYGSKNLFNKIKTLLELFIEKLLKISEVDGEEIIKLLLYSILSHLAQRALLHGSSLSESIEDKYFPEEEEEQEEEEEKESKEGLAIDINDPIYQDTLKVLNLAEVSFIKAIEIVENETSLKDTKEEIINDLNIQLSETLITLGNMLEPGEKQETVYKRASELSGVTI